MVIFVRDHLSASVMASLAPLEDDLILLVATSWRAWAASSVVCERGEGHSAPDRAA
jgi:hypothetical protein